MPEPGMRGVIGLQNSPDIKKIIRGYYEQLYGPLYNSADEMDKSLERQNLSKLSQRKHRT